MSGYDALDELYERLREADDAQDARRAGEITSETIRAARGGVVDESGRTPATAAENAADGEIWRDTGDSRDTRERMEADAWEAARLDMSRTWEERRDAIVALLDRQAALTEREACAYCDYKDANRRQAHKIHEVCKCLEDSYEREKKLQAKLDELNDKLTTALTEREICKWWRDEEAKHDERIHRISELQSKVDELRAELDAYDKTHMLLPLDADGMPIQIGDLLSSDEYNGRQFPCRGMSVDVQACGKWWTVCMDYDSYSGTSEWCSAKRCHHVNPRTVENVLSEFASRVLNSGHQWGLDAPDVVPEFAAEIRELMGGE